jgi:hypothetical protein
MASVEAPAIAMTDMHIHRAALVFIVSSYLAFQLMPRVNSSAG